MKIFIIGAARSGTKILRDSLSKYSGEPKVPFDINFIWKWGNIYSEHDELKPDDFNLGLHKKIEKYLKNYQGNNEFLIEKTVSNTIRIPFLLEFYPDAKFVFLYREPLNVINSVFRQWYKPRKFNYVLNKIRYTPLQLTISLFIITIVRKLLKKSPKIWGVNYPGIKKDLKEKPLLSVITLQWIYCYERALEGESLIPSDNRISVTYEDFVEDPGRILSNICQKFGMPRVLDDIESLGVINNDKSISDLPLDKESLSLLASRTHRL
ncbi:sulfotransferase [Schleiferiaceae bacterium]|nr:sulfotransferase [Schleiferiaceae bacterium]